MLQPLGSVVFSLSEHCLVLASEPILARDLNRRHEILLEAKNYLECSHKLAQHIKRNFENFPAVYKEILNKLERIKKEKENLALIKTENENNILKLQILIKEYDSHFQEKLKSFDEEFSKPLRRKKILKHDCVLTNPVKEESLSGEEEKDEPGIAPDNYAFDLDENIKLLTTAIKNEDLNQQIYLNSSISDFYRIQAGRIRNLSVNIEENINYLKQAINYLQRSVALIQQMKNGIEGTCQIGQLEYWTNNLLEDTKILLDNSLKHQKAIEDHFEETRLSARNYIMTKYGSKAWYKKEGLDIETQSLAAQKLRETKFRVVTLEGLKTIIDKALQTLQNPLIYPNNLTPNAYSARNTSNFFKKEAKNDQKPVNFSKNADLNFSASKS